MTEIKLEKRYPHSRTEDITDAFMRGYQQGKEDEHRWWSNHCANCKDAEQTEPMIYPQVDGITPSVIQTEPQTDCLTCRYNNDEWDSPKCDGCSKAHSNYEQMTDCSWK